MCPVATRLGMDILTGILRMDPQKNKNSKKKKKIRQKMKTIRIIITGESAKKRKTLINKLMEEIENQPISLQLLIDGVELTTTDKKYYDLNHPTYIKIEKFVECLEDWELKYVVSSEYSYPAFQESFEPNIFNK